jgi:hypothetical protein
MDSKTLKLIRRSLNMTTTESAHFFGEVNTRTYKRWEYGEHKLPGGILAMVLDAAEEYSSYVNTLLELNEVEFVRKTYELDIQNRDTLTNIIWCAAVAHCVSIRVKITR